MVKNKKKKKSQSQNPKRYRIENSLLLSNQRVGIAVSGGVDSMVLLDVCKKLRKNNSLELFTLHYNHKWRKKSFLDARLVQKYCKKNQITFLYSETKDKIVKDEEVARNERYSFFKSCSKQYDLDTIITAHHKDDQFETVLFRLARGTGPKGLLPIKHFLKLTDKTWLFRPFLNISKSELYDYAKKNKLSYNEDITNQDTTYKRNLIRLKLTPILRKINPEAENNILSCCDLIYAQNVALDEYCSQVLESISVKSPFVWKKAKFISLNQCLQKAFIYWFFNSYDIRGSVKKLSYILNAIHDKKILDLNNKFRLIVNDEKINFQEKSEANK